MEILIQGNRKGKITFDYLPCINYAMILNNNRTFNKFNLKNSDEQSWEDVRILLTGDMFEPCQLDAKRVNKGDVVDFVDANLMPNTSKLMALTESVQTEFIVHLQIQGEEVLTQAVPIMIMAFDQWHGITIMPELIAAFVTPNHPCLAPVNLRASKLLEDISGNKSLDSYQSGDFQRVANQIESIYNALNEEKFVYAVNPPSYEPYGQRIRLVNKVLKDKLGNCLELSLLLCSCLESIGIKTIIVFFEGHAYMGAWLDPMVQLPMVNYDRQVLINATKEEQRNLLLIEATGLTSGLNLTQAIAQADSFIRSDDCKFELFVDVFATRQNRIRPLPQSVYSESGWQITDTTDYDELFDKLAEQNPYDIHGTASEEKLLNKQLLWERKLLDLSLRNNLLNMKLGKRIVPLSTIPIDDVLKCLEKEELLSLIDDKDNFATVKELYRAARNSIEENGANTLFLSIGTMQWYEAGGCIPFHAPILFIPVEIVRHGAKKYIIRARDEEPIMNITLLEMMRQTFELQIPSLSPVPQTEDGKVDWKRVFGVLQTVIDALNENNAKAHKTEHSGDNSWKIIDECTIGIFSFTKFVMWNDIHTHANLISQHKLLRSMVEGHIMWDPTDSDTIDARKLDKTSKPADFALPVDVDSSQFEAVVDSGRGNTFILYGPPGTGKSQTITNMIANALFQGKRVLFVAEKKAALEVVQDRLGKIGLAPFCLELHSNKVDKKSFLAQMEAALNAGETSKNKKAEFSKRSSALYAKRQELNGYIESLHKKREDGLSLYDYINRYLSYKSDKINVQYKDIAHLSSNDVDDLYDEYKQMDTVIDILHQHPSTHPLLQLLPRVNTADNQREVTDLISKLPSLIDEAKKKEGAWWNRWFLKRTALQFAEKKTEWCRLLELADVDEKLLVDLSSLKEQAEVWNENADRMREWYHYSLRALAIKKHNVPKVHDYFLQGNNGEDTANAFAKGYYYRLAMNVIDNDENLRSFSGMLFEDVINKYRELTRQFQQLTREQLVCRITENIPTERDGKVIGEELTILRRRIASHGRAMSVRRIIDQAQHILPRLTPCMLMSPLSVAQYLSMTQELFDLVIFDEASQMPTSEAVGAIARGKAVVVVGDPKQMPPTSFFSTNNTNEDDIEIDDLDSVLDDCISLSVPSRYLNWHYRSKHESLIAFSNIHFYDGRLITFPSVDDQDRKVSITYVDGTYDFGKTRQNKMEALAIVNEVITRLQQDYEAMKNGESTSSSPSLDLEYKPKSIGIVAFSKVQSNLIEDLLLDALSKHKELESLAFNDHEPIFVKNLENVQGDERDIILFSVGYGPDKTGKVSMNFGPLNQMGGERRLNVAVSRARYEMKLFSTLHPEQIDLQRTNANGVAAMKAFLEYAEGGNLAQPNTQITEVETDEIAKQIAEAIEELGYEVHLNVGRSKFKVDIAIVDPNDSKRYLKGIILDSPAYAETPTARDREIVQPSILSILGWEICHIWTAEWLENKEKCFQKIL